MAIVSKFEHRSARNAVADTGSSLDVKEPGIMRMSKWGELSKEFCASVSSSGPNPNQDVRGGKDRVCGNLYLLARLSQLAAWKPKPGESGATRKLDPWPRSVGSRVVVTIVAGWAALAHRHWHASARGDREGSFAALAHISNIKLVYSFI